MKAIICGGGAAGMICAIEAAKSGLDVTLIEKNHKLGKKLYITGKGRCNLTNTADKATFFNNIVSNPKFFYSAYHTLSNHDTITYFERLGTPLTIERGGRVFPSSNKSSDIISALERELVRLGVSIRLGENVISIQTQNNVITSVVTNKGVYQADRVVLAMGGASYPATGSTGDGYQLAEKLGHKTVSIAPALTSIKLNGVREVGGNKVSLNQLPLLEGLSLKNVRATIIGTNGKELRSEQGEMLFTRDGVSGPIILTLSSYINRMNLQGAQLSIDLKPALSRETLDGRILRDFEEAKNKMYKNSLKELLPNKLIEFIISLSNISPDKAVHSITRNEREGLAGLLKGLTFWIEGLAPLNLAVVTAGGVDVRQINPSNMRSKIVENLAFAGEIIDIDALTGGFNLQIAFSSGYLAGINLIN